MTDEEKVQLTVAGAGILACVAAGIYYVKVSRSERKKRAKIREETLERLTVIRQSRDRVLEALADPNVSLQEAMQLWREENQFIDVITNQPLY